MAIDVSVQYNGGFLPDRIIMLTRLNVVKRLSLQSIFPSKRFEISPPSGECSVGLDAFRGFFKKQNYTPVVGVGKWRRAKMVHDDSLIRQHPLLELP